jgi:hypothetical protein
VILPPLVFPGTVIHPPLASPDGAFYTVAKKSFWGQNISTISEVKIESYFNHLMYFHAIGFFNEADTLESSSKLTYSFQEEVIHTQKVQHRAKLIKMVGD